MINWLAFGFGALLLTAGGALWAYHRLPRPQAWLMGAGAFIVTVAVVPWHNALAAVTQTATGQVWLAVLTLAAVIGFWFEAVLKHKHHRVRTPVIAATLGVLAVLVWADYHAMLASLSQSTTATGSALSSTVETIHSGAAAKAAGTGSHQWLVVAAGAAVVVVLVLLARRLEKRKPAAAEEQAPKRGRIASAILGRRALPSGRG